MYYIIRTCCTASLILSLSGLLTLLEWQDTTTPTGSLPGDKDTVLGDNYDVNTRMLSIRDAPQLAMELQHTAASIIGRIIGKARKAFVLDVGDFENKGDPALALGQFYLLSMLGVEVIFTCTYGCSREQLSHWAEVAKGYTSEELVIFTSGGGNIGGYPFNDGVRKHVLSTFPKHKVVILSQSTWFHTGESHLRSVVHGYAAHPDLHILLRDNTSYQFAREHFTSTSVYLAPDMAFGIGHVPRFFPPLYDVIWIHRQDSESPGSYNVTFPPNVTFAVGDWFFGESWRSPMGDSIIDNLLLKTYTGLMYILRGRVLVSDRLHGHILASLLDVPTVIIDNKIKKISAYRNSWTSGLERVVVADDADDAIVKAQYILKQYS